MTTDITNLNAAVAKAEAMPLHVIFIYDRSGSMGGHEEDVIGGYNSYIETLKKQPGAVDVSFVQFDNLVEHVFVGTPLADVQPLTREVYNVRGSTALFDAVGTTVSRVVNDPACAYIVVMHTDGQENASREWTRAAVEMLIKEREALGNWTFIFFGQGFDQWAAEAQASSFGTQTGNTMSYGHGSGQSVSANAARVSNVMRAAHVSSTTYYNAATQAADEGKTDEEIEKILKGEQ